ncbi:MAG TPA: response regulator [Deltaproteobacteria bacterium]|nr:response regulator [Deltaproteobacteria bacterium]
MSQLILVLEENPEIQSLIAASLKASAISVTQESNPDLFVQQALNLEPDLILLSNSGGDQNYKNCREIRKDPQLKNIPIILLVNPKDELDEKIISELGIDGLLRKPFEASMLQEQLSQFVTLDDNFGIEPDNEGEDFKIDMSSIDNQLNYIKEGEQEVNSPVEEGSQVTEELEQNALEPKFASSAGSEMDSMILDDISADMDISKDTVKKAEVELDENEITSNGLEVINDEEMTVDNGFEFDLKLDEDGIEIDSEEVVTDTVKTETDPASTGLTQLKDSGLEDKYAESRLKVEGEKTEQDLKAPADIDLEVNDFEDLDDIWSRSPELDQTPREGLTDISLEEEDFQPEFPENLSSFEEPAEPSIQDTDSDSRITSESVQELDNYELEPDFEETGEESLSSLDNKLLTDSVEQDLEETVEIEDAEQFVEDTSADEFEEDFDESQGDADIMSMVHESIGEQEESAESAMIELEDLSEQMEALDSAETEFEIEEEQFEEDLEKEKLEVEELSEDELAVSEDDSEDELVEFMLDELGDLLETDEEGSVDGEADYGDPLVEELEESLAAESKDLQDVDAEFDKKVYTEMLLGLEEDVFDSWDDAEDAFMGFDREKEITEEAPDQTETEASAFESFDDEEEKFEKADSFSFTENELKEIVTNSVQNALEKSIAASLVELAVSELKTQVIRMDQSRAL